MDDLKVLVVDDSAVYRKLLIDLLTEMPGVEVVGKAPNGQIALDRLSQYRPDLITLDVEMPVLNGIDTLKEIKRISPDTTVIMVSAHTASGARLTLEALQAGAFDFIAKPDADNREEVLAALKRQLKVKINTITTKRHLAGFRSELKRRETTSAPPPPTSSVGTTPRPFSTNLTTPVRAIGIGISTGGPAALQVVLSQVPANYRHPILIVQHMPPAFTKALAESLNRKCPLEVTEAEHGELIQPGHVYIAPGGKQMRVEADPNRKGEIIHITDDPPENFCKPSVDYLFRAMSRIYEGACLALIMTGMGADGVRGLRLLKRRGARVIAQDEGSCVVYGMPREAVEAGVVDKVVPLDQIAKEMTLV